MRKNKEFEEGKGNRTWRADISRNGDGDKSSMTFCLPHANGVRRYPV